MSGSDNETPIHVASGKSGDLEIYEQKVVIRRDSFRQRVMHMTGREKTIYMDEISAVRLNEGGITIEVQGETDSEGGLLAPKNENQIYFRIGGIPEAFREAKEQILQQKQANTNSTASRSGITDMMKMMGALSEFTEITSPSEDQETDSESDPLEILQERLARGEIDEDEYQSKKELLEDR